jgi:hypothetical protein
MTRAVPSFHARRLSHVQFRQAACRAARHVIDPSRLQRDGSDRDRVAHAGITPRGCHDLIVGADTALQTRRLSASLPAKKRLRLPAGIDMSSCKLTIVAWLTVHRTTAQTSSELFEVIDGAPRLLQRHREWHYSNRWRQLRIDRRRDSFDLRRICVRAVSVDAATM